MTIARKFRTILKTRARRRWSKSWRFIRKNMPASGIVLLALFLAIVGLARTHLMPPKINPAAYRPLLDTIAKGESKGNYNAYYQHATNTSIRFTDMSVTEVMKWQEEYVRQGSFSSAVGKYQIVRPTLAGLVKELKIKPDARFDEELQDRMAIVLLERRGAKAYVSKKLTREQFAANLAKEWAALPKVIGPSPEQSYYAGVGTNKSLISIDEVYTALATLEPDRR